MNQHSSLYKWILLLLIPILGIAYILYRKIQYQSPVTEQPYELSPVAHEEVPQSPEMMPEGSHEVATPEQAPVEEPKKIKKESRKHKKKQEKKEEAKPLSPVVVQKPTPTSTATSTCAHPKEIKLTDDLTKKSLGYKHWTGRYYPSLWVLKFDGTTVITFDGKEFTREKTSIVIDPEKPVKVHFDFEFLGGRRKGWKEVIYQIDKDANTIHIDFDWKEPKDDQILISPATPLSKSSHNNHDGK